MSAHFPNSGHTTKTLATVTEDWFETFHGKVTDRAFIEAVTIARRKSKGFFPSENDVFEVIGLNPEHDCTKCSYRKRGTCLEDKQGCKSFTPVAAR